MPHRIGSLLAAAPLLWMSWTFAITLAFGTASRAVLEIYGFEMLGRLVSVIVDARSGAEVFLARSVLGTIIYLPLVFSTVLLPWPRLGITEELADAARSPSTSGVWVDEPHRAIGAGAVYFLLMGLFELWVAFGPGPKKKKS